MAETGKPKMKWYWPLAFLAGRANDGFLSIARNAGKATRLIQFSAMGGLSKIGHGLSWEKKKVAHRANDGFLSIVRNAGKAARLIQFGAIGGLSKIEHGLSRKKKEEKPEQPSRTKEIKESAPVSEAERAARIDYLKSVLSEIDSAKPEPEKIDTQKSELDILRDARIIDETPEGSGSSPPGVKTENDDD